jgi:hypothetical protein
MKKIVSVLMLFSLMLFSTSATSYASVKPTVHKGTYYVKEKTVKVYKTTKTSSRVVVSLKKGTKVLSTKKTKANKSTWLYITAGKKKGWIQASKVSTKRPVKTNLEKLTEVGKKYGLKVSYTRSEDVNVKFYSFLQRNGYDIGGSINVYTKTKILGERNVQYIKGKYMMMQKEYTSLGVDTAIALGFPVSKKELAATVKKAQAHPHKEYKLKSGKIRVLADRGKSVYFTYYEDPLPDFFE